MRGVKPCRFSLRSVAAKLKYNYPEIGCWNRNWDEMAVWF